VRISTGVRNSVAAIWNWTFGFVLPNVQYAEVNVPINHVAMIETLLEVHAFQVFELGVFNGDPHVGNILISMGRDNNIGLIDYGQVKQLTVSERRQIAQLIVALCNNDNEEIVSVFRAMGFDTKNHDPWVAEKTARFFFQDDTDPNLVQV
jgi:aarF domain-containing kinase